MDRIQIEAKVLLPNDSYITHIGNDRAYQKREYKPQIVHLSQEPQPALPPPYKDIQNHHFGPMILLVLRCIGHTLSTSMQEALPLSTKCNIMK
jgi:hypothetical protein